MSRAVDFCPECVRPDAFLNVVFFIPNERAFLVIRFAKATSEPAIASPSATAASFADLTAVALIGPGTEEFRASRLSVNKVRFRTISESECLAYWLTGEPQDKAGAYAIQGRAAVFVEHLEGSFSAVMGLPLFETTELLAEFGINVSDNWGKLARADN